jgi:hypothetical protein
MERQAMRKATRRKSYTTRAHPVALAILNRQAAAEVILPRIAEHEALSAYQEGRADAADHERLSIVATVGLYLSEQGIEPHEQPTFAAGLDLLDSLVERETAIAVELDLLRRMVAAHDRQREQIGRGDYLKALQALQPRSRA